MSAAITLNQANQAEALNYSNLGDAPRADYVYAGAGFTFTAQNVTRFVGWLPNITGSADLNVSQQLTARLNSLPVFRDVDARFSGSFLSVSGVSKIDRGNKQDIASSIIGNTKDLVNWNGSRSLPVTLFNNRAPSGAVQNPSTFNPSTVAQQGQAAADAYQKAKDDIASGKAVVDFWASLGKSIGAEAAESLKQMFGGSQYLLLGAGVLVLFILTTRR